MNQTVFLFLILVLAIGIPLFFKIYESMKNMEGYSNYTLDKSLMRFYSTPNSKIENDQGAYSKWLYGEMPSGKSSGIDGIIGRTQHTWQWINP